ncbi:substrate-binding periplasmic protein [Paludibacterium purpuratum]|uniref:Amino acid ABC transporter substrate-binding protein (PAAT family) n=1 Tax=Paludibacterium purpuratum TaxID=1144873 RepID=A0A4V3DUJ2_9NEIS|nr:transporter substrate-binding domain-containing protein [Paludibacterium purpuratum]TDR73318.1 amino acid ABC transporter substrate-binding protein (PAAT family) [Paludibacterium purpuratum]
MNKAFGRLCAAVALCAGLVAHGEPVRLLTEDDPPFNILEDNGQIGGVSTEMVRELFRRADVPYTLTLMPWIRAYHIAVTDKTACLYSTTRTAAREKQFRWVGPLLNNAWAIYAGPHSPAGMRSLDDIRQSAIGGYLGDAVAQYLIERGFHVQQINDDARNVQMLALGRIDFWASGVFHARYLLAKLKQPDIHPIIQFETTSLYLACSPSLPDATLQRLLDTLTAMRNDGTLERIRRRY